MQRQSGRHRQLQADLGRCRLLQASAARCRQVRGSSGSRSRKMHFCGFRLSVRSIATATNNHCASSRRPICNVNHVMPMLSEVGAASQSCMSSSHYLTCICMSQLSCSQKSLRQPIPTVTTSCVRQNTYRRDPLKHPQQGSQQGATGALLQQQHNHSDAGKSRPSRTNAMQMPTKNAVSVCEWCTVNWRH